jgi:hypothetical protein
MEELMVKLIRLVVLVSALVASAAPSVLAAYDDNFCGPSPCIPGVNCN